MKRISAIVICVLLVLTLTVTAFAATSVELNLTTAKTSVKKGDTIEFTVSMSKLANCRSGSVVIDYNKAVFQYVSGKCKQSNADIKKIGISNGLLTGVFTYDLANEDLPASISGAIFTFKMKVLDDAAFGKSKISVSASTIKTTDGATAQVKLDSIEMNVSCDHSWGNYTKIDGSKHNRTCSVCQKSEDVNHAWNKGKQTQAATCKSKAVKTYTCACGATMDKSVGELAAHTWGDYIKVDDNKHKRTCSACQKSEDDAHVWDNGIQTQDATCNSKAVMTYTCTCGATKDELVGELAAHTWGDYTKFDDNDHKRTCSVCQEAETAAHAFSNELTSDTNSHWYACFCGAKGSVAAHTWDEGTVLTPATAKNEGIKTLTCTACGATATESIPMLKPPVTKILLIVSAALVVLSAAGVAVAAIVKKRAARY